MDLSTFLSAISIFTSEHRASQANDAQAFMEWLSRHHYTELKAAIESNELATLSVQVMLSDDRQVLLDKLSRIENLLGFVASGYEDLGKLSLALNPQRTLSDQAVSILRQLFNSGASAFVAGHTFDGPYLVLIGGTGGEIEFKDARYLEDDLETLTKLEVLNLSCNSQGKPMYGITRTAEKLLEAIGDTQTSL